MGRGIQADRGVGRVALAYGVILIAVVAAFALAAFAFVARIEADAMRPILDLPDGASAYRSALVHAALAIALGAAALALALAPLAYLLARVSTAPLAAARERERRFSADAAHELRTPLARIASLAQAARTGDDDPRDATLGTIATIALHAGTLVGDLLLLSRSEALPPSSRQPVDVDDAIATAVAACTSAITIERTSLAGAYVLGDVALLTRLFGNLIENAARHARSVVSVRGRIDEGTLHVSIDDDGDGVPDDLRERIFERFVHGPGSSGSGLGLPLARWIARAHGGDVHHRGGARFEVVLPRAAI